MGRKVAIITGASGGIGQAFARLLCLEDVDEVWVVARNINKLADLKDSLGEKVVTVSKDLTQPADLASIEERLAQQQPIVTYLVNNAGVARMGTYSDFTVQEIDSAIRLNCTALAALCGICIPYMRKGSRIINMSSASAFQPTPYINLYAATKAFEQSYSRALNVELKGTGITATAVCPSWVDTDLLIKEYNGKATKFPGLVSPETVAAKALIDAKKGKDMSVHPLYAKWLHVLAKTMPHKALMRIWARSVKGFVEREEIKG